MKIGIIGVGTVGETIYKTLEDRHEVFGFDKQKNIDDFESVVDTDLVFVCVPTPSQEGLLDVSEVETSVHKLSEHNYSGTVCIKSTMGLGTVKELADEYDDLSIIYSPEFLHGDERRWKDFRFPNYVVIGCRSPSKQKQAIEQLKKTLNWIPSGKFKTVTYRTAEIIKLAMNAFAGMKVSFANEINRISDRPEQVMEVIREDPRCAEPYTDPSLGPYNGDCLPKDILELINKTNSPLLRSVEEVNNKLKKEEEQDG